MNGKHAGWMLVLALVAAQARAETEEAVPLPPGAEVVSVEAYPERVELGGRYAYRQLLVLGTLATGETVDLTRVVVRENEPQCVSVTPEGLIRPVADGRESLKLRFETHTLEIPVEVSGLEQPQKISFLQDVQPALSRMGCNQGTCHGAKDGKAGFKLSLRGYDALFDHRALTDDVGARRFNRAAPDQSLFLLKATGSIPHVGGVRTRVGEPYYELLKSWVAQGCKLDLDSPRVTSIEVLPQNPIVPLPGMRQQMVVIATYSDGKQRDVTHEAFVESGNTEVVAARDGSQLEMLRRGEAPVLVRYEGAYAATTLTVMGDRSGFVWTDPPTNNYIDALVYEKLRRMKILPSELCTDEQFIRRVYLDLTGLPPSADEVRAFLADTRDQRVKRDELVDRLVGNPEFVEYWTNKWADLLQVNRKFLGEEGSIALRNWIKDAVASNKPYNEFAYEVLTGSGSTIENPPASYYKVLRTPDEIMENTTHLFLAIRFNCNKCHDHPFERWTQDQYYHLAAYFAQIGRKEDPRFAGQTLGGTAVEDAKPLVEVVFDSGSGEMTHERTGQVAAPAFPYDFGVMPPSELPRREQLAIWLTSPENPYFARSFVNRVWGYLFGVGIIEPIDDIRAGNPPTNPELLNALTDDFIRSGFDIQHMLRTICKSRVYQHSVVTSQWNEDDTINFSHALPRRLPAEVLFDAIHTATGAVPQIPGVPAGFRAAELPDAGVSLPFLDDFGRPPRESACECERSSGVVLGPIMKLVNGPTVAEALTQPNNALARLVAEEPDDRRIVEEVFLRFLGRFPTNEEVELALETFAQAGDDLAQLRSQLAAYEATLPEKQKAWEKVVATKTSWTTVAPSSLKSEIGAELTAGEDHAVVVTGKMDKDVYTITIPAKQRGITGLRLEVLPDASLPAGGPGRAANGNFVLNELRVLVAPADRPGEARPVKLQNARATFSQAGYPIQNAIDGNLATGWAVAPQFNAAHNAVVEFAEDLATEGDVVLTIELDQKFEQSHVIGKFRLALSTSPRPLRLDNLPADLAAALAVAEAERTDQQRALIAQHYRAQDAELQRLEEAVKQGEQLLKDTRLVGVQDLAWALINTPAFLFNR